MKLNHIKHKLNSIFGWMAQNKNEREIDRWRWYMPDEKERHREKSTANHLYLMWVCLYAVTAYKAKSIMTLSSHKCTYNFDRTHAFRIGYVLHGIFTAHELIADERSGVNDGRQGHALVASVLIRFGKLFPKYKFTRCCDWIEESPPQR